MAGHLQATVAGHAFAQGQRQAFHLSREALKGRLSAVAVHLAQQNEAGLAFDQGADRAAAERAFDHVTFLSAGRRCLHPLPGRRLPWQSPRGAARPVAGDQTGIHPFGTMNDLQRFRDDSAACPGRAPCAAPGLALAQGLYHRRLQPTARLGVDHGVDRLVAQAGHLIVGELEPHCRCDLLGRPAQSEKMVAHEKTGFPALGQLSPWPAAGTAPLIDALTTLWAIRRLRPDRWARPLGPTAGLARRPE